MAKLRAGRQTVKRGGYGVDRQLRSMVSGPDVYWSGRANSYVVIEEDGRHTLASINGIGEIRWTVESWNTDDESNAARDYFFVREA